MSTHAARLARLFTPKYAARINALLVSPAGSVIVKPNELESSLARPLHVAAYEPHRTPQYLAAQIAYGIIKGHPFMDGNKRTAFFLANEYLRAQGLPGWIHQCEGMDEDEDEDEDEAVRSIAARYIAVAKGKMGVEELAGEKR